MEKKTIGNFIAVLRKSKGMTQQELADLLNVSNKTISKWECNDTLPDLTLIPVIAEVFNVSCDEILRGEKINLEVDTTSIKKDKQINHLLSISIYRFNIKSILAYVLSLAGIICFFAIAYGFFKAYIALAIMLLFAIASLSYGSINLYSTNFKINSVELLDEFQLKNTKKNIFTNYFFLIILNAINIALAISIGVKSSAYAVIVFTYYATEVLPYLIISMIYPLTYAYFSFQVFLKKKFDHISNLGLIIPMTFCFVIFFFLSLVPVIFDNSFGVAILIVLIVLIVYLVCFTVFTSIVKRKNK